MRNVPELATGKWPAILAHFGVESRYLKNKHGPCPICGGKDRYRFDDKKGRGTWICNQCGSGDGFRLLELVKGWGFREAAQRVEEIVASAAPIQIKADSDEARRMSVIRKLWDESLVVECGDPVFTYLSGRCGIRTVPSCIRHHPALQYIDDNGEISFHPALIAAVTNHDGIGVGMHRIYLDESGLKALVSSPKKLLKGKDLSGSSIKLGGTATILGVAEGIETALAASTMFNIPVWASISSVLMEQWVPPVGVTDVIVFGDNDESFTGQASAFSLAKKLFAKKINVSVRFPEAMGTDWADVFLRTEEQTV